MRLHTCSEVISLARKFEEESAEFYRGLAQRYPGNQDAFLSFAKENKNNTVQVERAYYGVISDAIEGCFAFDIDPDEYALGFTNAPGKTSYADAIKKAIEAEDKIVKFYTDAAEQSKALMADVPRAFLMVVKKRGSRKPKLSSLLANETGSDRTGERKGWPVVRMAAGRKEDQTHQEEIWRLQMFCSLTFWVSGMKTYPKRPSR